MRDHIHETRREKEILQGRRDVLKAGAALGAAPVVGGLASTGEAAQMLGRVETGPFSVRAYGASSAKSPIAPLQIERRALGPNDVLLDVLYSGICHSDILIARSDGRPAKYPSCPATRSSAASRRWAAR